MSSESVALERDVQQRVVECRAAIKRIWSDRDDAQVLSEIHGLLSELRAAEAQLGKTHHG